MSHPPNNNSTHLMGGKSARLKKMKEQGFRVPELEVLTPDFHYCWLERLGCCETYLSCFREKGDPEKVRSELAQVPWEDHEAEHLEALFDQVSVGGIHPVSVRSSGLMEDLPGYSFAGQYDTVLNITDAESMKEAVRRCLLSPLNKRLQEYLVYHDLQNFYQPWMAIVVQRMIFGEASGVMFTWNVQRQEPGYVISAGYGLGEGVVSGQVETDEWILDANGNVISENIAEKQEQLIALEEGGVVTEQVSEACRDKPCLSEEQRRTLLEEGDQLTELFGAPQDIEFTVADGKVYLLQSRDVTCIDEGGAKAIFDNSNIVESYSGVTTPLTYTFIRPAYEQVYRQFYHVMGVPEEQVESQSRSYATMVTWIDGRVFYNLNSWFILLSQLPGYRFNREAMEQMMGIRDRGVFHHIETPAPYTGLKKFTHGYPQLIFLIYRLIRNVARSQRMVDDFKSLFHSIFEDLEQRNLEQEPAEELAAVYWDLEHRLLRNWQAPIVTDFNAMVFHGMLRSLTEKWLPEDRQGLANDLLVGLGNVESAQPTRLLVRMAEVTRDHPELEQKMRKLAPDTLAQIYKVDTDFEPIRDMAEEFIRRFGYRCIGELKLEEHTVRDNPAFLFRMVQHFLESGATNEEMDRQEREKREQAEADIRKLLKGPRRWAYRWVLNRARKHIRNREDLRFNRTRIFGKIREIFRGIGREMTTYRLLDRTSDVFYLTKDEVLGYTDGTTVARDFQGLAELRIKERIDNRDQIVKDRFETHGAVGRNRERWLQKELDDRGAVQTLNGTACSPGKVSGKVAVLRSPADPVDLQGKIMVAEQTDPGWVPLFPLISGLLVERGGLLSHSAVVGREMGIPTIVGIRYLTQLLEEGDYIEMDGSTGEVIVHKSDSNSSQNSGIEHVKSEEQT